MSTTQSVKIPKTILKIADFQRSLVIKKYLKLKESIQTGVDDFKNGKVYSWDKKTFLKKFYKTNNIK
jgi:hypothetical protein